MAKISNLLWVFALLSVMAVGGGSVVLPEMHKLTVDLFGWVTDKQFRDVYSLGQVAPGPNMLMVFLIGHHAAGLVGAIAVGIAFFLPDCLLAFFGNRLWQHYAGSPWHMAVQRGLAPVIIGLMLSGTYAIARLTIRMNDLASIAIAAAVFILLMWREINPGILVALGGIVYLLLTH